MALKKTTKKKEEKEFQLLEKSTIKNSLEINFSRYFNLDKEYDFINTFNLSKKRAYCNKIELIVEYVNGLLKDYKYLDKFMFKYLYLKFAVDNGRYTLEDEETFINDVYHLLFTKSFIAHIKKYTEEHYAMDIDSKEIENLKYNKVLQFSDTHCKILHNISLSIKVIIPIILQFAYNNFGRENPTDYLILSFERLFEIFSPDVDMFAKLWESVYSRVVVTKNSDKTFWNYTEILGISVNSLTTDIVKKLMVDIIPKYVYDQNLVSLNHVIINNNIDYTFRFNFPINLKQMNLTETDEGITDFDKLTINTARIDEGAVSLNRVNISSTITKLKKKFNVEIDNDELNFYIKNLTRNDLQSSLVFLFFGKYFGSSNILRQANRIQYTTVLVLMKKVLEEKNFKYIPQILSSKINVINEKSTLNKKILMDIIDSEEYNYIISNNYNHTNTNMIEGNIIIKLIATFLNNKFIINEYLNKENGNEIKIENSKIMADEVLRFINFI